MSKIWKKLLFSFSAFLVFSSYVCAASSMFTANNGELWQTEANWNNGVPGTAVDAYIGMSDGSDCIVDSGYTANAQNIYIGHETTTYGGPGSLTINGTLNTTSHFYVGFNTTAGYVKIDGGTVTIPSGKSTRFGYAGGVGGTLEIVSGKFTTGYIELPFNSTGESMIKLYGGELEVLTSIYLNSGYYNGNGGTGEIDIKGDGVLKWSGDRQSLLNLWINNGWIYTSEVGKSLEVNYDSVNDYTTIYLVDFTPGTTFFTNDTGNELWGMSANWSGGIPDSVTTSRAYIGSSDGSGCIITSGYTANAFHLYVGHESTTGYGGPGSLTINGTLNRTGILYVGYKTTGYLKLDGGTVSGSSGLWTRFGDTSGANGTLEITAGKFTTGYLAIPFNGTGESLIKLYGGELEVLDSIYLNYEPYTNSGQAHGEIDIKGNGILKWSGDQRSPFSYWIDWGWIYTSEVGKGLEVNYDDANDVTIVKTFGIGTCDDLIEAGLGFESDLNGDCYVDFYDFAILADQWLGDFSGPLDTIAEEWLYCNNPQDPNCMEATVNNIVTVEQFGAVGDGITDDTDAFQAAAAVIQELGGGTLELGAGKVYRVGRQYHEEYIYPYYQTEPIFELNDCYWKVNIVGNGATLKANDGLRTGSFDPDTGEPYEYTGTDRYFGDPDFRAYPYWGMFHIRGCRDVEITNVNLDGNIQNLIAGGRFGLEGMIECQAFGLRFDSNKKVTVIDVNTSYHGMDGIYIAHYDPIDDTSPEYPYYLENVVSNYNGRQGLSWVGGNSLTAVNCEFSYTATVRNDTWSNPACGVDIEEQDSIIRNGNFLNCTMVGNRNYGLVWVGDVKNIYLSDCLIETVCPDCPTTEFEFDNCTIY